MLNTARLDPDGVVDASVMSAEIGEVVLGRAPARRDAEEITFFKSVGNAVQDVAVAARVLEVAERIAALEPRVERNPDSPRAWAMLAQSYRESGAFGDAVNAYARARAAGTDDAWLIARQAEALLLANDRNFTQGVKRLLRDALARDARNGLALMLAGQAEVVSGDTEAGVRYWRRLAEALPEGDARRATIENLIARAEAGELGNARVQSGDAGAASSARVTVSVSLAERFADRVAEDAAVFVYARRKGTDKGPPLAVTRTRVGALPARIELSDAQSMTPQSRLSEAGEVVITARVSPSGDVTAQPGDLEGRSDPVAVGADAAVELVIDARLP